MTRMPAESSSGSTRATVGPTSLGPYWRRRLSLSVTSYDVIEEVGATADEMHLAGPASRNRVWSRIKADVLGLPVLIPEVADSGLLVPQRLRLQAWGWPTTFRRQRGGWFVSLGPLSQTPRTTTGILKCSRLTVKSISISKTTLFGLATAPPTGGLTGRRAGRWSLTGEAR